MSSIRSASSSTQIRTRSRRSNLRATRSSSRPGVAITMSAWRARLACGPIGDAAIDGRDVQLRGRPRSRGTPRSPGSRARASGPGSTPWDFGRWASGVPRSERRTRASCPIRCASVRARRARRSRPGARALGSANAPAMPRIFRASTTGLDTPNSSKLVSDTSDVTGSSAVRRGRGGHGKGAVGSRFVATWINFLSKMWGMIAQIFRKEGSETAFTTRCRRMNALDTTPPGYVKPARTRRNGLRTGEGVLVLRVRVEPASGAGVVRGKHRRGTPRELQCLPADAREPGVSRDWVCRTEPDCLRWLLSPRRAPIWIRKIRWGRGASGRWNATLGHSSRTLGRTPEVSRLLRTPPETTGARSDRFVPRRRDDDRAPHPV